MHDEEFAPAFDAAGFAGGRVTAWHDGDRAEPTPRRAGRASGPRREPARAEQGRLVILTSGTTGTPKGAPREPSGPPRSGR